MTTSRHGNALPSTLLLVAANLLIPIAMIVFAAGFFPYKPLLPGLADYHVEHDPAPAPFDRLIFMVVDALRSDFVFSANSGFQFTQSLIRDGAAVPFTAHATSPTVTMARLKAMTTGSIPSFLDVILNLDETDETSSLATQDSWLAQMKAKKAGKLVMYGDDTWLKLFPAVFDRADGTTSFFVSDFTEVDNNVTRHVPGELGRDDWNTMILHYLGLDHIGHKGGPRSSHMIPKQREMDGIVRQIFEALESETHLHSALLVLCGDHGMNDAGNHGASSPGETSPALVFMSPKLRGLGSVASRNAPLSEAQDFKYYTSVEQSDLAPTLGALLGFPVPINNLGALIPDFLPLWHGKRHPMGLLMNNARQILSIITAAFGPHMFSSDAAPSLCSTAQSDIEELACDWQYVSRGAKALDPAEDLDPVWVAAMTKAQWLRDAQGLMSGMASNYNMPRIYEGLGLAAASVACAVAATWICIDSNSRASLLPLACIILLYGVMMFASSYVEEEQHFWYWTSTAWIAHLVLRSLMSHRRIRSTFLALSALIAMRLTRGWNQTGQKFAGDPDIVKTFVHAHPAALWQAIVLAYGLACVLAANSLHQAPPGGLSLLAFAPKPLLAAALLYPALAFKAAFTNSDAPELVVGWVRRGFLAADGAVGLVSRARIVFAQLAVLAAAAVAGIVVAARRGRVTERTSPGRRFSSTVLAVEPLHYMYTLLAMTQSRATNIPLFVLFELVRAFLIDAVSGREGEEREQQQQHLQHQQQQQKRAVVPATRLNVVELSITSLLLQYASFFAFGGSNAISSVDLSSAYNGVAGYNVTIVGVLTFLSNWAAPVYWTSATALLLLILAQRQHRRQEPQKGKTQEASAAIDVANGAGEVDAGDSSAAGDVFRSHVAVLTVSATCGMAAVMAACTMLRTHLFIWTVFSPKYLYCMAWSLVQHLVVNVGLGGCLFWLGSLQMRRDRSIACQ